MMKETSTIKKLLDISISIYLSLVVSDENHKTGINRISLEEEWKTSVTSLENPYCKFTSSIVTA